MVNPLTRRNEPFLTQWFAPIWYSRARQTIYVAAGGEEQPMRDPDQADLTDDYGARRKIAPRQTFAGYQTGPGEGSVADAMSEPLRLTIVYEDADDGDGWVGARIPPGPGCNQPGDNPTRRRAKT
jgi:hypothetical protein